MKTKAFTVSRWEDLIFENRNKDYGAYVLRRSYNDKVIVGFFTSSAFIVAVLFLFTLVRGEHRTVVPTIEWPGTIKLDRISNLPKPPAPKPPQPRTATQINQNLPPLVTTAIVDEIPVPDPVVDGASSTTPFDGDQDGTSGDQSGTSDATGTALPVRTIVNGAEVMPAYEGGMEAMMRFIKRNMKYPATARRQMIGGTVFVSFVVNGDGTVSDLEVIKGFHPDCDKEAVRVIKLMPGWIGGKQNNFPVNVRMVLPVKFKIE
jgi:periplasmic protein TonB